MGSSIWVRMRNGIHIAKYFQAWSILWLLASSAKVRHTVSHAFAILDLIGSPFTAALFFRHDCLHGFSQDIA